MIERNFRKLLEDQWKLGKFVSVGLDPEVGKIPESIHGKDAAERFLTFNRAIIDTTNDIALAYKPNSAFYEALGERGIWALHETIRYINTAAPHMPVILDAKRGDIASTNAAYATSAFDFFGFDAITVQPYLGGEALQPFFDRREKGIIVLCRTSNSGAPEFQDLLADERPLYEYVASHAANEWNKNGNCGVVVGATYPEELKKIRKIVGDMTILIPGIGRQGGDLEKAVRAGMNSRGEGIIIHSSSSIIFASNGPDFAEAACRETKKLNDFINQYRK